jgi:DNA-binding GntR family transcriptional regulator
MARLKPQAATSLVEQVTQEIKASILAGTLPPGEQFTIADLCAELDVSHIPVREALRRLEADGLVHLRPSKSAIVTPLSLEELDEVYRLRLSIESDLAARSAPSYTPEQMEEADQLLEKLRASGRGSQGLVGAETHARLHEVLLRPAAGPISISMLNRLWDVAERYITLVYDVQPIDVDELYRRHFELVTVARSRKGPAIRKAIIEHLTASQTYMSAYLTPQLLMGGHASVARQQDDDHRSQAGQSRTVVAPRGRSTAEV